MKPDPNVWMENVRADGSTVRRCPACFTVNPLTALRCVNETCSWKPRRGPAGRTVGICVKCRRAVREKFVVEGKHDAMLPTTNDRGSMPEWCNGQVRKTGGPCICGRTAEIVHRGVRAEITGERCTGCGDEPFGCECEIIGTNCRCGNVRVVSLDALTLAVCSGCVKSPGECTCVRVPQEASA